MTTLSRRIAGELREFARRRRLHQLARQAGREPYPLALDVGAGCLEQLQRFRVVAEIDAGFLQDQVSALRSIVCRPSSSSTS
jgi:hypothetical protein